MQVVLETHARCHSLRNLCYYVTCQGGAAWPGGVANLEVVANLVGSSKFEAKTKFLCKDAM